MIKVIINEKEYDFPECWKDLKLNAYERLVDARNLYDENAKIRSLCHMAASILNIPIKELYFTETTEFEKIVNALQFLETDMSKVYEGDTVEICGETYFIKKDLEKLSVGEVISFEIFCQDNATVVSMIAPSLALLLRKDLSADFDSDNYVDFVKLIKENVDVETATGVTLFFWNLGTNYTIDSPLSLTQEKEEAGENL